MPPRARIRRHRRLERLRVRVGGVPEGLHLGQGPVGERLHLGIRQQRVRTRRAPDGLRGVVDEDVERPLSRDGIGECDHLGGVAQVDADDAQAVQPVGGVRQRREAPHGVPREARRDRQVRAVAEQTQRDVHADLGPPAGEQRATAGEVGARVALGVAEAGAVRAELVIERVDERVRLLADVAVAGPPQLAGDRGIHARGEVVAAGLVVDAVRGAGRGLGHDRLVGLGDRVADLLAAGALDGLEHPPGGAADGDVVGMLLAHRIERCEHPECGGEVVGVEAVAEVCGAVGGGIGHHADSTRATWEGVLPRRP